MPLASCDSTTLPLDRLDQSVSCWHHCADGHGRTYNATTNTAQLFAMLHQITKIIELQQKRSEAAAAWSRSVLCMLPFTSDYSQNVRPHTQRVNTQQKRQEVYKVAVQTDLDRSSMSVNCLPRLLLEGIAAATNMPHDVMGSKDLAAQALQLFVVEALCL